MCTFYVRMTQNVFFMSSGPILIPFIGYLIANLFISLRAVSTYEAASPAILSLSSIVVPNHWPDDPYEQHAIRDYCPEWRENPLCDGTFTPRFLHHPLLSNPYYKRRIAYRTAVNNRRRSLLWHRSIRPHLSRYELQSIWILGSVTDNNILPLERSAELYRIFTSLPILIFSGPLSCAPSAMNTLSSYNLLFTSYYSYYVMPF